MTTTSLEANDDFKLQSSEGRDIPKLSFPLICHFLQYSVMTVSEPLAGRSTANGSKVISSPASTTLSCGGKAFSLRLLMNEQL